MVFWCYFENKQNFNYTYLFQNFKILILMKRTLKNQYKIKLIKRF